jgi:hypothetical protein
MKYPYIASGVSGIPFPFASFLSPPTIASTSSLGNKSEIQPLFKISLIGIKKLSFLIYESVIMKTIGTADGLAIFL